MGQLVDVKVKGMDVDVWRRARAYGLVMGLNMGRIVSDALQVYLGEDDGGIKPARVSTAGGGRPAGEGRAAALNAEHGPRRTSGKAGQGSRG